MPSRGDYFHEYLKKKSTKKIIDVYGDRIDFIKHEQPQNNHVIKEQNYFKIKITLGSPWHDSIELENLIFADVVVQVNRTQKEINFEREKRKGESIPEKKIVIIECETTQSSLVTGKSNPKYHSYKLIKHKHGDDIVLILATFNDINVKTDLFDSNLIWRFKRP